jgi:enamine deaminase RidA (YjgF/YER057c/UK114 family)
MSLGGSLSDIVRTRVYLQDAEDCEAVSLVHGRYFRDVCPANTTFEISQLIDDYLVEIEAEAVIEE